jgi:hypothetical protein
MLISFLIKYTELSVMRKVASDNFVNDSVRITLHLTLFSPAARMTLGKK